MHWSSVGRHGGGGGGAQHLTASGGGNAASSNNPSNNTSAIVTGTAAGGRPFGSGNNSFATSGRTTPTNQRGSAIGPGTGPVTRQHSISSSISINTQNNNPQHREAPALSGPNPGGARRHITNGAAQLSGTRTSFTDVSSAGTTYGFPNSAAANAGSGTGGSGGGGVSSTGGVGAALDSGEEEINQLFRELEFSVGTPHAPAVMRDVVEAIETRALANFDPLSRDFFLEQRIRDVLTELSRTTNEQSLMLAAHLIEALIPVAYTSPQHKCIRLCRSVSVLLQCGLERPAREAQMVLKKLLELDLSFQNNGDTPLKAFIPKELKDNCELAIMQLHGRVQQAKALFQAQYLSIMLSGAATAEVNPRYLAGALRGQLIQLSTTLAGTMDPVLRNAAYDCLVSIFSHTSNLRHNEIVIENRRVCDESLRTLNTSHHNESSVVSALMTVRALLGSRGLQAVDKQITPQLSVLVTEQQRISKSSLVRSAVCDLVPIIAPIDINSTSRRSTYVAIIMEPVKNVRDERSKLHELHNVAACIDSVGYSVLDSTNRTNLDSILHRYLARPETQVACWGVIAAICLSRTRDAVKLHQQQQQLQMRGLSRSVRSALNTSMDSVSLVGATATPTTPGVRSGTSSNGIRNMGEASPPMAAAGLEMMHSSSSPSGSSFPRKESEPLESATTATPASSSTTLIAGAKASSPQQQQQYITSSSPSSPLSPAQMGSSSTAGRSATAVQGGWSAIEELVRRGVPHITHAVLSEELVRHLSTIQQCMPALAGEIQQALDRLVDVILKEQSGAAATAGTSLPAPSFAESSGNSRSRPRALGIPQDPVVSSQGGRPPSPLSSSGTTAGGSKSSAVNRFTHYFRGVTAIDSTASSGPIVASAALNRHYTDSASTSRQTTSPLGAGLEPLATARPQNYQQPQHFGPGLDTSTAGGAAHFASGVGGVAANPGGVAPVSPAMALSPIQQQQQQQPAPPPVPPVNDLTVALEVFSLRPVTSVQQLEEIKVLITPFQAHADPKVRRQGSFTVITCLSQWVRYAKEQKTSTYSSRVTEILETYVKNVLLEVDPVCRLEEIKLLSAASNLRPFLSEQRILTALLSFLNSTSQVREKTVELLVAITQDPKPSNSVLAVQQSLYVTVESCVVVLEYTSDVRTLIRSMADLQTFTRLCVRPLSNHLGRIFYAFRKKLNEDNVPDVISLCTLKTLETILETLSREEKTVLQYQDDVGELYPSVVNILKQTSSPALCHAAISMLVYMCRMCTLPAQEQVHNKQELITALVHVYTGTSSTREELLSMLTLFGQLGAVDPSIKTSSSTTVKKNEEAAIQDEADLELTYDYTVIVYRTLSRMLDVSLSEAVCTQALRTLLQFIRYTQDKKDQVGGVHAVRAVLQVAKRSTDSPALRIEALHVLAAITAMRHERIARLVLPEIVVLLEQLWFPSDHALFRGVLEVVSALKPGKLSGKEQSESWAWLYPRLIDVALQDHTESREFCLRVVEIILNASYIPPHCIPIAFPVLIQFVQQSDQLAEVRSQSLCAAVHVVCELKAIQYFPSLLSGIRTLTRHCELNEDLGPRLSTAGVRESLKVLAALHPNGRPMIKQLRDRLGDSDERAGSGTLGPLGMLAHGVAGGSAAGGAMAAVASLVPGGGNSAGNMSTMGSGAGHTLAGTGTGINVGGGGTGSGVGSGGAYLRRSRSESFSEEDEMQFNIAASAGGQEVALFMKHVEWGLRAKESKLREWFADFQKCIILVSPHPAFRMMVDLFDKHEPLRRELFHPSFKSLYEALSIDQIKKVNEVLTTVLNCNDNELVSKCLGLADYLDHNQPNIKPEVLETLRALERPDHKMIYSSESESLALRSNRSVNSGNNGSYGGGDGSQNSNNNNNQNQNQNNAAGRGGVRAMYWTTSGVRTVDESEYGETLTVAGVNTTAGKKPTNAGMRENENAFVFNSSDAPFARRDGREESSAVHQKVGNGMGNNDNHHSSGHVDNITKNGKLKNQGTATSAEASGSLADEGASAFMTYIHPLYRPLEREHFSDDLGKVPPNVLQLEAHIPFKPNVLFSAENIVRAAERTHMYDKAFSYLENKFMATFRAYRYSKVPREAIQKVVWPLAWLYSEREMHDSVVGLFHAIRYKGEDNDGFGFELLRWWEAAQRVYAKSITPESLFNGTASPGTVEGYVRTLCFCGEWAHALSVAKSVCNSTNPLSSGTVATCGAMSAWILGAWDDVEQLAECISTTERSNAVLKLFYVNGVHLHTAIRENTTSGYESLRQSLAQSKLAMDESLRTLLPLSYAHAYENLTMLQHFTEMEELIDYCHCRSTKARMQMLERWNNRFMHLKSDSLQPSLRSLMLHSLVLPTNDMSDMILHFCESMSADYPQLTEWAMNWLRSSFFAPALQEQDSSIAGATASASAPSSAANTTTAASTITPGSKSGSISGTANVGRHVKTTQGSSSSVQVGFISHLWARGKRTEAVARMEAFLEEVGPQLEESNAACYGGAQLRLGTWKQDLHADSFWKKGYREEELGHFHKAIRAMPSSFEAWHSWGLINYRVQQRDHKLTLEEQRTFVEAAHQGFVAAICRCRNSSEALSGVMRLLQLWVVHNGVAFLKETVADSISRIPVDHWVQAIPQLIGHLSNESHDVREVISSILRSLCEVHPQAVVFPLLVVIMSDEFSYSSADQQALRRRALVQSIIQHCPKRIRGEAEQVARMLVDVSAIPIEKIRENLCQVATAWNPNAEYEEDADEVRYRLQATLQIFTANRRHLLFTVGDIGQFVQMVIDDDARGEREKAASIVNQLADEVTKHISEKLGREPQKAMEPLLRLRNLSIAVFGEYDISHSDYPTIASFSSKLDVIPSKKRPRRIQLNGSDGCLYSYCLKGNEDIRMDERVMQLFGMVNVLLSQGRASNSAYIHRFPVIPISSNVGLLGWVENANTINNTICNYRTTISKVRTHHETSILRAYVESFGHWDKLSVIQRSEVLDYVMSNESCQAVDVSRAMWHRANTAEQWLDRRTAFTTSLATMSMVGYVMGLGDRHLGNILLSMSTGKIVHIDFGDSFDVGRLRHVLPETIPFRLTRMLTNAMEVFGVDGVFRASATRTQGILHRNRDSIMALLSAFVYDPIVQHKGKMKNMMEKSRSPQDVAERVRNKLRGTEMAVRNNAITVFNTTPESCRRPDLLYMSKAFDDNAVRVQSMSMSPGEQVNFLIDEATRVDNYSTLYFGWGPLW